MMKQFKGKRPPLIIKKETNRAKVENNQLVKNLINSEVLLDKEMNRILNEILMTTTVYAFKFSFTKKFVTISTCEHGISC